MPTSGRRLQCMITALQPSSGAGIFVVQRHQARRTPLRCPDAACLEVRFDVSLLTEFFNTTGKDLIFLFCGRLLGELFFHFFK